MADYTLSAKVTGDSVEFEKVFTNATKTVNKFQAKMEGLATKVKSVGDKISGAGKAMSVGITVPLAAAGTAAVNAASDFDENLNKVDVGRGAQKAQADLLRRHFQAEKSHAFVCFLGGEQRHAQRHGGFTHGRARAHQHQLAAVKAGEHPIQIVQPGRHARQLAFQQAQFLNAVEGGKQHLLNGFQRFRAAPAHDDVEDQPFRVPKYVGHRVGLGIALAADGLGRGDQLAQRGLFLHDFDVSAGVGRGGHEAHRFQQIGGPAHAVQRAPAGKLVPHRHQIDWIARDMQRLHGGENFPVLGGVKILRRQGLKGKRGRTAVLQHRAQHGTLRVYAAGRQRRNIILTFHRGVRSFPAGA